MSIEIQLDITRPEQNEDVGFASYLKDLMGFTEQRIRDTSHSDVDPIPVDRELLKDTLHQPFDRITETTLQAPINKPVSQVRIAIEVLRSFLELDDRFPEYCEAAYRSLLANIGTSYTELRLARTAELKTRQSLANRLGIAVEKLDELFLIPEQITEAKLQSVFGLMDTTQDPLTPAVARAKFLTFKLDKLHALWLAQDSNRLLPSQTDSDYAEIPVPIIDPDIIEPADLKSPIVGNLAYDLLIERQEWVQSQRESIERDPDSTDPPLQQFDDIVNSVFGTIDLSSLGEPYTEIEPALLALEKAYEDGLDIEPILQSIPLELSAFFALLTTRKVAETGVVLLEEWEELYDILVQVQKRRQFRAWATAEVSANLVLSSQYFVDRDTQPNLIPWRSTWRTRRDWEKTLEARIKQRQVLLQSHQTLIEETETIVLPLLRDLLIAKIDRQGYPDIDIADWLTQRLSISFKYSGDQRLTRLEQGIETLQNTLLTLRTGRLATLVTLPVGSSPPTWEIIDDKYSESDFDIEWKWMGSYATWRGAMFAFSYPENYLSPTIRDKNEWTEAFSKLVTDIRQIGQLTPDKAEALAAEYMKSIEGVPPIAHWSFLEDEGTIVSDVTGNGHTAILKREDQWELNGWMGGAISFKGHNDYATVPHAASIYLGNNNADFSITFAIYLRENFTGNWRTILGKRAERENRWTPAIWLRPDSNQINFIVTDATGRAEGSNSQAIEVNTWTHVAYVKEGQSLKLYLNGELNKEASLPRASVGFEGPLYIGGDPHYGGSNALFDEIRIYDYALSSATVKAISVNAVSLTSQLSKEQLRQRRSSSRLALEKYIDPQEGGLKPDTPSYLKKIFFFVPMLLAQSLQKSGNYQAALDWYQTVYAYELLPNERKIYYGLEAEETIPTEFSRTFGWLLEGLDVFDIANHRANVLTRSVILSIVRCYLAYADAEFTKETNESIPFARRLYITALELINLLKLPLPVAHWAFDQDERPFASDSAGNSHKATLRGTQWQSNGWRGGALSFNGQGDRAEVSHSPGLKLGKDDVEFSITFAFYLRENATGQWRTLLRKGQSRETLPPGIWLHENDNRIRFNIRTVSGSTIVDEFVDSQSEVQLNTWTHVTCIKQGKSLKLYINGHLNAVIKTFTGDSIGSEDPLFIGGDPNFSGTNALFDEIRIYDRALSPDAIAVLAGIDIFPPNPVVNALSQQAELNLSKLRSGRNIAGMERIRPEPIPVELVATDEGLVLSSSLSQKPTVYRYSALIERAKQLVATAQQIEASYLAALERQTAEEYTLFQAGYDLRLTQATIQLQDLRVNEADSGIALAQLQKNRSLLQRNTYQGWIEAGPNQWEQKMLDNYKDARDARNNLAKVNAALTIAQSLTTAASGGFLGTGLGAGYGGTAAVAISAMTGAYFTEMAQNAETAAQINSFHVSHERRKDEWELQKSLAEKDIQISGQQIVSARNQKGIVQQERRIAGIQAEQAEATVDFLMNKFLNAELYEWMSGILSDIYSYFLQQATAMAHLAQTQLAFERQSTSLFYIQVDYWQPPSNRELSTNTDDETTNRRGLTGSARLLQDITELDQYAFETNKRKLQLTQTFSLAQLTPFEFQKFRETGSLPFETSMKLFDQDFPGHYLRLIKRVRVSVIALVPPTTGIRATLTASGISRVVIGRNAFQTIEIRRDPEMIAFTSPSNATGLFELEPQGELLLPFEGMGVATAWELQLPKAANPFDYLTLADVLITIEYTALHNEVYRQQVIQQLDRTTSGDRPFSFRNQFADAWFDLNNPDQTEKPMVVSFQTRREDFPPNVEDLSIEHVVLYIVRTDEADFEVPVTHLHFTEKGSEEPIGGGSTTIDGVISTRRGNGSSWLDILGKSPVGQWELSLKSEEPAIDKKIRGWFEAEQIEDILLVITYQGETPPWPA